MTDLPRNPALILQELLERSGVLRQPQHGVIDFIHRTFLEYMGARAAINAGDIGVLVDKAKEQNWREVVVFAAGHAQGRARDELIRLLLKDPPLWALGARPIEADVTAACCLETVRKNLDPKLLEQLAERATRLFPPKDFSTAQILVPAATLDPRLILSSVSPGAASDRIVAASIRCAALVGTPAALKIIRTLVERPGTELIEREMLKAWGAFDPSAYLEEVVRPYYSRGSRFVRLVGKGDEIYRIVQFLAATGGVRDSLEDINNAITDFEERKLLRFGTIESYISVIDVLKIGVFAKVKILDATGNWEPAALVELGKSAGNLLDVKLKTRSFPGAIVRLTNLSSAAEITLSAEFAFTALLPVSVKKLNLSGPGLGIENCNKLTNLKELRLLGTMNPDHLRMLLWYSPLTIFEAAECDEAAIKSVLLDEQKASKIAIKINGQTFRPLR